MHKEGKAGIPTGHKKTTDKINSRECIAERQLQQKTTERREAGNLRNKGRAVVSVATAEAGRANQRLCEAASDAHRWKTKGCLNNTDS